jgi:hypothetical protein
VCIGRHRGPSASDDVLPIAIVVKIFVVAGLIVTITFVIPICIFVTFGVQMLRMYSLIRLIT